MTQSTIIEALQNGPLTSEELCNLTGLPKSAVLSAAKKLRYKGDLITEEVKVGRYWIAKYTLKKQDPKEDKTIICGIQTYGIFTKAEYAVMAAQAKRLLGRPKPKKEITNNQFI
jgi:predicted transcriptional regulator